MLELDGEVAVRPIPVLLAPPGVDARWWRDRVVRLVGRDRRPRIVGPLARRSGLNRIVSLSGSAFVTEPSSSEGFATIIGDSGGPALIRLDGSEPVAGILRGGPGAGSRASVFAATFDPDNARWPSGVFPPPWGQGLPEIDPRSPFGRVTDSRTAR